MIGAAFTGMILSWIVSLAAHISFRRVRSAEDLAVLPLRSPLGAWGSVLGLIGITVALIQTWLYPIVNLYSAVGCIGVLVVAYMVARAKRKL
jgi:L-asparagine transporter-like permease